MSSEDLGRKTSRSLTEARTVLSRARTARDHVLRYYGSDPESTGIVAALNVAIDLLEPYERTGRPSK